MAELLKVREITIDTMQHKDLATKEEELKVMRFYQNDLNSAKLLINVTHDKVVTDFSTATKVQIAFLKPDGKRVFQDVQNVNQMQGKYYVVLSTQTLIAYGNVVAQLRLTFPDNKVIETCKFVFAVDESIMSDEAMKSTNEFPVIQKAIEAGEKLEGKDIDGIIAAGAKADAALVEVNKNKDQIGILSGNITDIKKTADGSLPKTGGTMTGEIIIDSGALMRFKGVGTDPDWAFRRDDAHDGFVISPRKADNSDWDWAKQVEFRPDNFIVNGNTNLLKKTGGIVTGEVKLEGGTAQLHLDEWAQSVRVDQPTADASARGFDYYENNVRKGGFGRFRGIGTDQMYIGWGEDPWDENTNLTVGPNKFTYKNKPVAMRDKDGRVTLTLTADAINVNPDYPALAIRRGNTVTLRMEINKIGEGTTLTTLPVDMRPTDQQVFTSISNDGTTSLAVSLGMDGTVTTFTQNKPVRIIATYVVD
ncbi:BppU family phage baseplate upper protein [Escherichia coli]|uniref:BppU family phage baseplate upper protein n=5 Tax=Bacteria TaxID=2 RepID=UPI001F4932E8|nr:BppU family phage baseplate upper protein [Escherichia coli]